MASIVLDGVTKVFGGDLVAVNDVSLQVGDGEFIVLVGPSGCGKSTILRLIAGLEEVTAGEIYIGDQQVTDLPPKERDVAMVFQNYALYPHMNVDQNIGFGLKLRRTPARKMREQIVGAARVLSLEPQLNRKPAELSGGQRQRVAMGRAMVREPLAFLMDEPLSNLDAKLRVQMRTELARLHARLGTTTVYVTHDQVEAMTLGERVAVLKDGILQQVDLPKNLYSNPANLFVAGFLGSPPMNLVEARVAGRTISFADFELPLPRELDGYEGRTVIVGIRPSDLEDAVVWSGESLPTFEVRAEVVEDLGSEVNVLFTVEAPSVASERAAAHTDGTLALAGDDQTVFCARLDSRTTCGPGAAVRLTIDPARFYFFDPDTGEAIGQRAARTHANA
jgi:multiple sugar transport system ATP-binding protein